MWQLIKQTTKRLLVCAVVLALFLGGFPSKDFFIFAKDAITDRNVIDSLYHAMRDKNVIDKQARFLLDSPVSKASAATFQMETGYYVGNGGALSITGLGFRPEMIVLKSNTNTIATVFHTNIMPDATTAYMGTATADSTAGFVQLDADGFTVYSTANTAQIRYTYIAFAGSDCSASGTMCIGSYVGNGAANQAITSVGFQPDMVWAKRTSNERSATWRSSSMPTNYGQYFSATAQDTTGTLFQTLDATGFTVGLSNNTSTGVYYYVAFKEVSGFMDVGSYTGNATNDRSITGVGFKPDWVFLKNADAGTPVAGVHSQRESYGDSSGYFTNTANVVDSIQLLETDGFQVGTHSTANGTGNTIYYSAFKGAAAPSASGSFQSASGSYTGDNTIKIIEGLDFKPDLVIIKGETTQQGVFRTSIMPGNSTAYLGAAAANFSGGITAMNHDGFTIGDNATVNSNGVVYHWQAFGNAWNPHEKSGAADFAIGAYYGNTIDNRDITGVPFQPDMVVVKRNGASAGLFRTSAHTGDLTSAFAATADAANHIQAFNTDGFEVGNVTTVINTDGTLYWWFAFKEGTDFDVGTYAGNASDNRDITNPGFDPDLVWIKRSTAVAGVTRPSTLAGDLTQYFINTAQAAGRIKSFVTGGFRLGTQTEVNASGGTYYFVAWDNNTTQGSVTPADYAMEAGYFIGNGYHQKITGLGFRPELVIIKPDTNAGHGSIFKTRYMPESGVNGFTTNSAAANLTETSTFDVILEEDGFTIMGANTNTSNVGHTWIAFAGSNCTTNGTMCIGSYIGNGSNPRTISTGFKPSYVSSGAKSGIQYFNTDSAINIEGDGAFTYGTGIYTVSANYFSAISTTNFEIGTSLNTNATIFNYFSFMSPTLFEYDLLLTFGNTSFDNVRDVTVDPSNNIIITGSFQGTVDFDATGGTDSKISAGAADVFITKYNADGTYGWTRTFGSTVTDTAYGVTTDSSGNVFVTGTYAGTTDFDDAGGTDSKALVGGSSDIFITKYNSNGTYGWTRVFGSTTGGSEIPTGGAKTDSSGNVFISGEFAATTDFDGTAGTDSKSSVGSTDIFITKYNSNGTYGWTRAFGGTSQEAHSSDMMDVDSSGNVFVIGTYQGTVDFDDAGGTDSEISAGGTDIFITKYNSNGTYGWTNVSGTASANLASGMTIDSSDNIFTIEDSILHKYNSSGTYQWETAGTVTGNRMTTDSAGNIFITGTFSSTVDFDGTSGVDKKSPSYTSGNFFITKYNANASYGWTITSPSTNNSTGYGIATDSSNNIIVAGTFNGITNFYSSEYRTSAGENDGFIIKYDGTQPTDESTLNTKSYFYTGSSIGNRDLSTNFLPGAVFLRGDDAGGYSIFNSRYSFGNNSCAFNDVVNITDGITSFTSTGFQVGSSAYSNSAAVLYYYNAFKDTSTTPTPSGSFTMETGTYVGNGAYKRISGLSGKPDLVIIKGETTQQGVFRTKIMGANTAAYLGSATANLALAISSLNHDGFNVGNSATVNSSGVTYHYQAFYNAYDGLDHAGATDFAIGHYYGNGIDSRDITELPFQPDMVTVKRSGATAGGFRTSAHTGDLTSLFAATADTANIIQTFNTDGFEIGTAATANTAANNYWWFAFKEGSKFDVGTYTGNATDNRDITNPAHTPDLVWIKRSTAVAGVMRPGTLAGDLTQWFINTAQAAGRIKALISSGFTLGTQTEVNASGGTYYFSSWSAAGVAQPTLTQSAYRFFENTDTTDVGTALEVQNTAAQLANAGDAFRLRLLMAVDDANLAINGEDFKLQFADKGAGTCASPSGGTPASYTDVTDATVIAYNDNATPADGTVLTANANDPTDGGRTIVNQSYQELNDFTNDEAAVNNGQTAKWDFALVDNGADPDTTFCFRAVTSTGTVLDTYTAYPEITTAAGTQSLTFSISDNSVGFGNLTSANARYATGDTTGSTSDSADAHTISVAASATDGYSLTVNGSTLTCASCGGATIDAIGGTAVASSAGTEQFGLRFIVNSGTGASTAPYASANWAFDTASFPDEVGSGAGDGSTTVFGARYIANTASISDAGEYSATLTYTATATY